MSLFGLFLEGLLSFLSPCVLPLVPLYMSYLTSEKNDDKKKNNLFLLTIFFVLGISVVFLILALSIDKLKPFIENYSEVISIVGGTIIIIFGLHEVGLINISCLNFEKRININLDNIKVVYIRAFILGFLFSFSWSPCIGPMLSSAVLIAASETYGALYILVYALGLIIPFLLTGLFTSTILDFLKNKRKILKYVTIVSGVILIAYGIYMIYGGSKEIVALKNNANTESEENNGVYVPDYEFIDQYGNNINLLDYKDKYVMLNFVATWCTYCINEIPEYTLFSEYDENIVCFYVMSTLSSGVSEEEILKFIEDNDIKVPVLIDRDNVLYSKCSVSGYPTLFIVDKNSKFLGYIAGAMNYDGFVSLANEHCK